MTPPLHVTFFGNVNNEMYRFAVALKEQGVRVRLITLNEGALHDPTSFGYPFLDSKSEILKVDLNDVNLMSISKEFRRIVSNETLECDFAIFTGATIAFAHYANSPYSVFLSGSDAIAMTDYRVPLFRVLASSKRIRGFLRYYALMMLFVFFQRKSLRLASFWISLPEVAFAELTQLRTTLKCEEIILSYLPIVLDNQVVHNLDFSRGAVEVTLVARFNGEMDRFSSSLDDKGSSTALEGVLQFVRSNPNSIFFKFFSKGSIPEECKLLIHKIGVFCKVEQMGAVPFHEFLNRIASTEVVIDSVGPSPVARNSIESLSLGKYVIANFTNHNPLSSIPNSSPLHFLIHNATSPDEVAEGIKMYIEDRAQILELAMKFAPQIRQGFSPSLQGSKLKNLIESHLHSN